MRSSIEVHFAGDVTHLMLTNGHLAQITLRPLPGFPQIPPLPEEAYGWYAIPGDQGTTLYLHAERQREVVAYLDSLPY